MAPAVAATLAAAIAAAEAASPIALPVQDDEAVQQALEDARSHFLRGSSFDRLDVTVSLSGPSWQRRPLPLHVGHQ
jgi:hypothetical protein